MPLFGWPRPFYSNLRGANKIAISVTSGENVFIFEDSQRVPCLQDNGLLLLERLLMLLFTEYGI